jgi:hypothetical protein
MVSARRHARPHRGHFCGTEASGAFANVDRSFYGFGATLRQGTCCEVLVRPPDDRTGRAALAWVDELASGAEFDEGAREFVTIPQLGGPDLSPVTSVLMTVDAVGGAWTYELELATTLGDEGVCVTSAAMSPEPSAAQRTALAAAPIAGFHHRDFALEWTPGAFDDFAAAGDWLLGLERRVRPDLVHLNGFTQSVLPFRAQKVVVGHSDVMTWWRAVYGSSAPSSWDDYARRVRHSLRAADAVITPTKAVRRDLYLSYDWNDCVVINNGRRRHWTVATAKEPFVLAADRVWDEAKNLRMLQDIVSGVRWPMYLAARLRPTSPLRPAWKLFPLPFTQLSSWLARASPTAGVDREVLRTRTLDPRHRQRTRGRGSAEDDERPRQDGHRRRGASTRSRRTHSRDLRRRIAPSHRLGHPLMRNSPI